MSLRGRVVLVTGVSRRGGIGAAIARRLAAEGARLFLTGWAPHDAAPPWGRGPRGGGGGAGGWGARPGAPGPPRGGGGGAVPGGGGAARRGPAVGRGPRRWGRRRR